MTMQKIHLTKELRQIDSLRWLAWMLFDWTIIVIFILGAIRAEHWIAWCAAIFVIGNRQHAMGILIHDSSHYLGFRNRFWNDFLANCLGAWLVGWTVQGYRDWHLKHHRHTGKPKDPEMKMKLMEAPHWDLPLKRGQIFFNAVRDIFGRGFLVVMLAGFLIFPAPKRRHTFLAVVYPMAISALLIYAGLWEAVALWFISAATLFPVHMRLRMWLEHLGSDNTHRIHLGFWEAVCLAPHNTWYHWEHHEYPIVPLHQLPKLRKLDKREPVISLQDLMKFLFHSKPIPSGFSPGRINPKPKPKQHSESFNKPQKAAV